MSWTPASEESGPNVPGESPAVPGKAERLDGPPVCLSPGSGRWAAQGSGARSPRKLPRGAARGPAPHRALLAAAASLPAGRS